MRNPNCQLCILHKTCKTICLWGTGKRADVMLIGEAPGANEDMVGTPFIGRSGKILENLLRGIKLAREEVYITNAVKCRPPENRTPNAVEMNACNPYLEQELNRIKPKVIITLGLSAYLAIFPEFLEGGKTPSLAVIKKHGPVRYEGIRVLPTYHPASTFYSSFSMDILRNDFARVPKLIKEENHR